MIDLEDHLHEAIGLSGPTPCQGPERDLWTSEDKADRRRAAQACDCCPAFEACRNLARAYEPTAGVWAGEDLTRELSVVEVPKLTRRGRQRNDPAPEGYRTCNRCEKVKPLEEYGRDHARHLGRRYDCKACCSERAYAYHQRKKAEREARSQREEAS